LPAIQCTSCFVVHRQIQLQEIHHWPQCGTLPLYHLSVMGKGKGAGKKDGNVRGIGGTGREKEGTIEGWENTGR